MFYLLKYLEISLFSRDTKTTSFSGNLFTVLWCSAKTCKINLMVHYVLCLLRSEAEMIISCKIIAERSPITIGTEPRACTEQENHATLFYGQHG